MRTSLVFVFGLLACATGGGDGATTREDTETSIVSLGSPRIIRAKAGTVRVTHLVTNARLRATILRGLEPANQHLEYRWERDGAYQIEVSGRYEHTVLGAAISGGRVESRLTYMAFPNSLPPPTPNP